MTGPGESEPRLKIHPEQAEWRPKVRPGDLVFAHVAEIIKNTGQLPEDVRVMLSAWLGLPDEGARKIVKAVLEKYGGVPQGKDMTGQFGDAVFNFVGVRIRGGTVTEAELYLLTPWLDCPRDSGRKDPTGRELTVGEVVNRAITAGERVIEEQKAKAAKPPERKEAPIVVEYAGASSRGGRTGPDEDSVFYPGKLILGEIYRKETDEEKAGGLAHILSKIGVPRTKEQILAVGVEIKKLIDQGKFAGLYLVADGMGGMGAGEIASSLATFLLAEQVTNYINQGLAIDEELLKKAFFQANQAVVSYNENFSKDSGTTLVVALIDKEGKAYIANAGDTRAYILNSEGRIRRITTDHSLVEGLVKQGMISRKETYTHDSRNIVENALGRKKTEPEIFVQQLEEGDILILCCDGVWEGFPPSPEQTDEQVNENLRQATLGKTPAEMARILTAKEVGETSRDNTSAVVVKWRG